METESSLEREIFCGLRLSFFMNLVAKNYFLSENIFIWICAKNSLVCIIIKSRKQINDKISCQTKLCFLVTQRLPHGKIVNQIPSHRGMRNLGILLMRS